MSAALDRDQVRDDSALASIVFLEMRCFALCETHRPLLFATDYLGPTLRRALIDARVSFADATGWVHLAAEDPLVVDQDEGRGTGDERHDSRVHRRPACSAPGTVDRRRARPDGLSDVPVSRRASFTSWVRGEPRALRRAGSTRLDGGGHLAAWPVSGRRRPRRWTSTQQTRSSGVLGPNHQGRHRKRP